MSHATEYLGEVCEIASQLEDIHLLVDELCSLRKRNGRLFLAGLGGSAANCSHAANDFRQLCGIDAHCLTDNVAGITARANDSGWNALFDLGHANSNDALMVLSVGGGTLNVSFPLVAVIDAAKKKNMPILGIVGRDGGYAKKHGDAVVVIPTVNEKRVTPHTEAFQMVILHCLVSHPDLQRSATKW